MFLVHTYIDDSEIEGYGLFAGENIEAGQTVWVFNKLIDICLTKEEVESLPPCTRVHIYKHAWYVDKDPDTYCIALDKDQFVNHSDDPNLATAKDGSLYAVRDIDVADEITQNYEWLDKFPFNKK